MVLVCICTWFKLCLVLIYKSQRCQKNGTTFTDIFKILVRNSLSKILYFTLISKVYVGKLFSVRLVLWEKLRIQHIERKYGKSNKNHVYVIINVICHWKTLGNVIGLEPSNFSIIKWWLCTNSRTDHKTVVIYISISFSSKKTILINRLIINMQTLFALKPD